MIAVRNRIILNCVDVDIWCGKDKIVVINF